MGVCCTHQHQKLENPITPELIKEDIQYDQLDTKHENYIIKCRLKQKSLHYPKPEIAQKLSQTPTDYAQLSKKLYINLAHFIIMTILILMIPKKDLLISNSQWKTKTTIFRTAQTY